MALMPVPEPTPPRSNSEVAAHRRGELHAELSQLVADHSFHEVEWMLRVVKNDLTEAGSPPVADPTAVLRHHEITTTVPPTAQLRISGDEPLVECSWAEFISSNCDDRETLEAVANLKVGEIAQVGVHCGLVEITRLS
jgi:hypothetical protein